jgi:hypothetical protein
VPVVQRATSAAWRVGHGGRTYRNQGAAPMSPATLLPRRRSCPGDDVHAAQRQPRQDPRRRGGRRVVAKTEQGPRASRRAARTSRRPTAASSGRCSPRSASPARPARSPRCRPAALIARRCWCWSGSARPARAHPSPYVRRAAGAAARAVTNAASVALALPADSPELVRAVTEGFLLGGYTFTAYKKDTATARRGARRGRRAQSARRGARRRSPPSRRRRCRRRGQHAPATG